LATPGHPVISRPLIKSEELDTRLLDDWPIVDEYHHPLESERLRELDKLPLEHFGNQQNMVLSHESDIWNLSQLKEENRIMAALWARWIVLNR
jgi:hypothetical protein